MYRFCVVCPLTALMRKCSIRRMGWISSVLLLVTSSCSLRPPYSVHFVLRGVLDKRVAQQFEEVLLHAGYHADEKDFDAVGGLLTSYFKDGAHQTRFTVHYLYENQLEATVFLGFSLQVCCSPGPQVRELTTDMKEEVERTANLVHSILIASVEPDSLTATVYERVSVGEDGTRPWHPRIE